MKMSYFYSCAKQIFAKRVVNHTNKFCKNLFCKIFFPSGTHLDIVFSTLNKTEKESSLSSVEVMKVVTVAKP